MKKFQMKWLALSAVSALAIAGCVAQDGSDGIENGVGGRMWQWIRLPVKCPSN